MRSVTFIKATKTPSLVGSLSKGGEEGASRARLYVHRHRLEQGPDPNGEREIDLVEPRAVPGEIKDDHKDQRHGE